MSRVEDITAGREPKPVPLESGTATKEFLGLEDLEYTPILLETRSSSTALAPSAGASHGCDCHSESRCDSDCGCVETHGYFYDSDGILQIAALPPLHAMFECSNACDCSPQWCRNRITQGGVQLELAVRLSSIPGLGLGLFTCADIRKGQFVCIYAGEVIDPAEAQRRWTSRESRRLPNYILVINELSGQQNWKTIVDPTHRGNVGRFINHACPPLTSLVILPVRPAGQLTPLPALFARRDIAKGEELSFDYSDAGGNCPPSTHQTSPTSSQKVMTRCLCGSTCCRQYMPFDPAL